MSEVMTVRVPEETRDEMAKFKVNWSEYVRDAIRKRIVELRREEAFKEMDEIKSKVPKSKLSVADEVIKWRRRR